MPKRTLKKVVLGLGLVAALSSVAPINQVGAGEARLKPQVMLAGKLISCHDADTYTLRVFDPIIGLWVKTKFRLAGLDAPETCQAAHPEATARVKILLKQGFLVSPSGKRSYDRLLGDLILADGRRLSEVLASEGWGWADTRFKRGRDLVPLVEAAKSARLGLWGGADLRPPWCSCGRKKKDCN